MSYTNYPKTLATVRIGDIKNFGLWSEKYSDFFKTILDNPHVTWKIMEHSIDDLSINILTILTNFGVDDTIKLLPFLYCTDHVNLKFIAIDAAEKAVTVYNMLYNNGYKLQNILDELKWEPHTLDSSITYLRKDMHNTIEDMLSNLTQYIGSNIRCHSEQTWAHNQQSAATTENNSANIVLPVIQAVKATSLICGFQTRNLYALRESITMSMEAVNRITLANYYIIPDSVRHQLTYNHFQFISSIFYQYFSSEDPLATC